MILPETLAAALAGLAVGFLGSAHCVAMCGGIAGALSVALPPERRTAGRLLVHQVCAGLGRLTSYAVAGTLAGAVGLAFAAYVGPGGSRALRVLAAALLLALGLSLGGWWHGLAAVEQIGARVWRRIMPLAAMQRPARSILAVFVIGIAWGWLPCGLVYSTLAVASTTGDPVRGALTMAAFGLGTLPATTVTGVLADRLARVARGMQARRAAGVLMILFALWTLVGGVGFGHGGRGEVPCHESPRTHVP
jgi:sulfite exporter TauE/SafE